MADNLTIQVIQNLTDDQLRQAVVEFSQGIKFRSGSNDMLSQIMEMCRIGHGIEYLVPEAEVARELYKAAALKWVNSEKNS